MTLLIYYGIYNSQVIQIKGLRRNQGYKTSLFFPSRCLAGFILLKFPILLVQTRMIKKEVYYLVFGSKQSQKSIHRLSTKVGVFVPLGVPPSSNADFSQVVVGGVNIFELTPSSTLGILSPSEIHTWHKGNLLPLLS